MWKCLLTHTGNVDLLLLVCSVSLFAVSFTQNALYASCDWKSQKTLKTVTANVISSQTIKRQSHNAQLQQHCCTRSQSSCSNYSPSAAAHARSRLRHSFTAPSIMRWSRRSHSSTMRWRSSSTFAIFPLLWPSPVWFPMSVNTTETVVDC